MTDIQTSDIVAAVDVAVAAARPFTAHDITSALRAAGHVARHAVVRGVVHDTMAPVMGWTADHASLRGRDGSLVTALVHRPVGCQDLHPAEVPPKRSSAIRVPGGASGRIVISKRALAAIGGPRPGAIVWLVADGTTVRIHAAMPWATLPDDIAYRVANVNGRGQIRLRPIGLRRLVGDATIRRWTPSVDEAAGTVSLVAA